MYVWLPTRESASGVQAPKATNQNDTLCQYAKKLHAKHITKTFLMVFHPNSNSSCERSCLYSQLHTYVCPCNCYIYYATFSGFSLHSRLQQRSFADLRNQIRLQSFYFLIRKRFSCFIAWLTWVKIEPNHKRYLKRAHWLDW